MGGLFGGLGALVGRLLTRSAESKLKGRVVSICAVVGAAASLPVAAHIVEPRQLETRLERHLLEVPTFAVLKQYYPSEYELARGDLRAAIRGGKGVVVASDAMRAHVITTIHRAQPLADQPNTLAMMHLLREEGAAMQQVSPDKCGVFFAWTERGSLDLEKVFSPELQALDAQVTAALMKQAATAPHPWPKTLSPREVGTYTLAALNRASPSDRVKLEAWAVGGGSPKDLATYCLFNLTMLDELLEMPQGQGAAAYQALVVYPPEG